MAKSYVQENLELRYGKPLQDVISEQFAAGKNQGEIAKYLGISYWTFRWLLHRLGAEIQTTVRFHATEKSSTNSPLT